MKNKISRFCILIYVIGLPALSVAQERIYSDEFSSRPKGVKHIVVGMSFTRAFYGGLRFNVSNQSSAEITVGVVPFAAIFGLKGFALGGGYNWYFNPDKSTSPFFSLLASYYSISTISDEFNSNFVVISPTLGIDYLPEFSKLSFSWRIGIAEGISTHEAFKTFFSFDVGAGWKLD